ncbi:MAG: gamma-glutamyltransferase, partial [Betaproteobacteria bacterium]
MKSTPLLDPARRCAWLHRTGAAFILLLIAVCVQLPAHAAREAIASTHPLATQAGMKILSQGGNAFDAAVAVASTLAVVEPFSSGLGGGGFFLLHRNSDGFEVMLDAREIAPGKARPDMYLGSDGQLDTKSSLEGAKAAAIPGLPAALPWLARKYGRLPLATVLAPAIAFARDGFATDARFTSVIGSRQEMLKASAQLAEVFLDHNAAPATGFVVRQPNLARTLEAIAKQGEAGFYRGDVARRLVSAVQAAGGIWAVEDLERYKIVERKPERFTYRGATITCAALPSAGGLALAQSLQILERYPLAQLSRVDRTHLIAEALR